MSNVARKDRGKEKMEEKRERTTSLKSNGVETNKESQEKKGSRQGHEEEKTTGDYWKSFFTQFPTD